ncbi:hypothetical protein [Arthrobacter rhizosphaerae]|uniref:hypothetical protein n=1 Tax=Arthrobacter rhizosphaerae TaxID=2855490 RepID=UPI001FF3AE63|nr:hypothetical protein [Arthrobacter rhizosphaerae]
MNNEYELVDGTPRYGSRSGDHKPVAVVAALGRAEEYAEAASRLGLDHIAAAIDRRLTAPWADREDPLVAGLRKTHPDELAAAHALVKLHLGSQRQWRLKAQAIRDKHLDATMRRRRSAGVGREILFMRLGLMLALITPPAYVVATSQEDILKLLLTGAACIAAAFIGGHFITVRSRIPVMPNIKGAWLNELREDIVNATLVAVLRNKAAVVDGRTVAAAERGWKSIRSAAAAVESLQS